jgi:hypothetical protein
MVVVTLPCICLPADRDVYVWIATHKLNIYKYMYQCGGLTAGPYC